jgi:hypothetical protein
VIHKVRPVKVLGGEEEEEEEGGREEKGGREEEERKQDERENTSLHLSAASVSDISELKKKRTHERNERVAKYSVSRGIPVNKMLSQQGHFSTKYSVSRDIPWGGNLPPFFPRSFLPFFHPSALRHSPFPPFSFSSSLRSLQGHPSFLPFLLVH